MAVNPLSVLRKHCLIFAHLNNNELEELYQSSEQLTLSVGEYLLKTGTPATSAYIILSGKLASVLTTDHGDEHILDYFGMGQIPGEMELEEEADYQTALKVIQDTTLIKLDREIYLHAVTRHEKSILSTNSDSREHVSRLLVAKYLDNILRRSKLPGHDTSLKQMLEKEWLEFEDNVLSGLVNAVEWKVLERGQYLFRKGDDADGAYILVSGVLGVTLPRDDGTEQEIARVYHGEIVGELSLVADEKRSANIMALRECELFKLSASEFHLIGEQYPRMMLGIHQIISERFIQSRDNIQYRPKKPNIAVFNLQASEKAGSYIQLFLQQLSRLGTTQILTSERVDRHLGTPGIANTDRDNPAHIGLMHWLNRRESNSRFVVYCPDETWNEWSCRCITQADHVVIFADAQTAPDFNDFIEHVEPTGQTWKLVLIHPEDTERPSKSARWLRDSKAQQIYNVRDQNTEDLERITRILAGRALSLVLGGGGARGFAHIGVLRALEDTGLSVDMVGATSMGAPLAGWLAQGKSAGEIRKLARKSFHNLIDLTLPLTSIINGRKITRIIDQQTAEWDIEDYWLPFFCVSTNLTTAEQVIHTRGNSALACRASVSIPGVLPPVPVKRNFLVDGGVLNNLPIDIMRELNPSGTILAIDVVSPNGTRVKDDYGLHLSGWRQLFRMINPFQKPLRAPTIGSVMMQSMILGSSVARSQALEKQLADYYQNIHIRGVGLLAFDKVDQAEKSGYDQSIEPIKVWVKESGYRQI